jgi:hypothetical protein
LPGLLPLEHLWRDYKRLHMHHVQLQLHELELGHWAGLHRRQVNLLLRESVASVLWGLWA